jgi:long-chain acyl-CoA synthetase
MTDSIKTRLWSTVVPHTSRPGVRGDVRRAWNPTVHPQLGVHGCRTLYEAFRRGVNLHPLGPCLGFRAISSSGFATPYIYSSYTECLARVDAIAAGLDELQLVTVNSDDDGGLKILGVYMKNCVEWILAEHAVYTIGGCTAPFYDTLGPETVQFILSQTNAKSVVSTRTELPSLCAAKQAGLCPSFEYAILVDGVTPEASSMASQAGLRVISLAQVEATGATRIATSGHKHTPPTGDDVATFCYTSGTTGDPKGALITHQNFMSNIAGMHSVIDTVEPTIQDRHLSYLPLAHIFERVVVAQILVAGGSVAFYRGDPMFLLEDLQACRPTMLPVAPRVLNKIYDKVCVDIGPRL